MNTDGWSGSRGGATGAGAAAAAVSWWPELQVPAVVATRRGERAPVPGYRWTRARFPDELLVSRAGIRLAADPAEVGWSLLLQGVVEHVEIGPDTEPLVHRRGRYVRPS